MLDTFYVKLFGSNDCGIDTQQYAIVVNPNKIKLNVAVNGNQVNGCTPHNVLFVNNTTGANLFRWDFGDGSPVLTTTKGVDSVSHTYTNTGNYNVNIFATNSCSDTLTVTLTQPSTAFTASQTHVNILCFGDSLENCLKQVCSTMRWNDRRTTRSLRAMRRARDPRTRR